MNILEVLTQLRDDLKEWTTNNILSLKNYVDKTRFSGIYDDLTNKPDIDTKIDNAKKSLQESINEINKDIDTIDGSLSEANENIEQIMNVDIANIQSSITDLNNAIYPHESNIVMHITNEERATWNNKAEKSEIPTADELLSDTQKNQISTAYTHSQTAHAPADAQKNSDITQEEIEAKLTGRIYTHNHSRITFDTNASNSAGTVLNSSSLPKDFDRGIQCTFSENQTNNFFNNMTHAVVETIKPYGSIGKGTVAHQWIYPYKNEDAHRNKIYTRSILLGGTQWGEYAELYTSLNKPTPEDIGAVSSDDFVLATDDDIRALFTITAETNIEDENNPESNNNIE